MNNECHLWGCGKLCLTMRPPAAGKLPQSCRLYFWFVGKARLSVVRARCT